MKRLRHIAALFVCLVATPFLVIWVALTWAIDNLFGADE